MYGVAQLHKQYFKVRYNYVFFSDNCTNNLLPVVMFIHGEMYEIGIGNAYDGSLLGANGHIVAITITYRMASLYLD